MLRTNRWDRMVRAQDAEPAQPPAKTEQDVRPPRPMTPEEKQKLLKDYYDGLSNRREDFYH